MTDLKTSLSPEAKFHRHPGLPGVELLVQRVERSLTLYCHELALVCPVSWEGTVRQQRSSERVRPGQCRLIQPGEVFTATTQQAGVLQVVFISPEVLRGLEVDPQTLQLTEVDAAHLVALAEWFRPNVQPLDLRYALLRWALIEHAKGSPQHEAPPSSLDLIEVLRQGMRRMRDSGEEQAVNLETWSGWAGMSRFQLLRRFKHRYGITPYAYQLQLKLAVARAALRAGKPPAAAAADGGFFDQAHLSRHFKRLIGVTPKQYALAGPVL
jgi:AraC-like DNA-binding protein